MKQTGIITYLEIDAGVIILQTNLTITRILVSTRNSTKNTLPPNQILLKEWPSYEKSSRQMRNCFECEQ